MSDVVVVDASLAVKWLVLESDSEQAYVLASSWAQTGTQLVAPYLMPVEVANALRRRVIRGEVTPEDARDLLEGLLSSGIELMEPPGIHSSALALARTLGQDAVYDAHPFDRLRTSTWPWRRRWTPNSGPPTSGSITRPPTASDESAGWATFDRANGVSSGGLTADFRTDIFPISLVGGASCPIALKMEP